MRVLRDSTQGDIDNYFGAWDLSGFTNDRFIQYQSFLLLVCLFLGLVHYVCFKVVKKWKILFIPEPAIAVVFGIFLSLILHSSANLPTATTSYDGDFFFLYLLPPLTFQAGYTQDRSPFMKNWFAIMTYANLGTVLSTLIFAYGLSYLGQAGLLTPMTIVDYLCFGSLISATDPVTTLSVFADLKVEGALQAMVYGSSAIDDAVAIIMFRAFSKYLDATQLNMNVAATIIVYLVICLIASFMLGILFGYAAAYFFMINDFKGDQSIIICVIVCLIYVSYFTCTVLEISGIISCMFAAISFRYFLEIGSVVSKSDLKAIAAVLSMISKFVEVYVFFSIGMSAVSTIYRVDANIDFRFVGWSILFATFGRVYIYPLSFIINYFNGYGRFHFFGLFGSTASVSMDPADVSEEDIVEFERCFPSYVTLDMQHMILFSGLRGPLALSAAGVYNSRQGNHFDTIYMATLIIVLINIFVCGSLTHKLLYQFDIKREEKLDATCNRRSTLDLTRSRERTLQHSMLNCSVQKNVIDEGDSDVSTTSPHTAPHITHTNHMNTFLGQNPNNINAFSGTFPGQKGSDRRIPEKPDEENKNSSDHVESVRSQQPFPRKNINQALFRWFENFERSYIIPRFVRTELSSE